MGLRWGSSKICFSFNNKGYWPFAGRYRTHTTLKEYDPDANSWIDKFDFNPIIEDVSYARYGAVGVLMDQFLYIGTGAGSQKAFTDLYRYDPSSNTCIKLIDMPVYGRTSGTAFAIDSKLYLGLGSPKEYWNKQCFTDFWEFDPSKQKP